MTFRTGPIPIGKTFPGSYVDTCRTVKTNIQYVIFDKLIPNVKVCRHYAPPRKSILIGYCHGQSFHVVTKLGACTA